MALSQVQIDIAKTKVKMEINTVGPIDPSKYVAKGDELWNPKNPPPGFVRKGVVEDAKKFDDGKARYDLLPGLALQEVARVLSYGANKYSGLSIDFEDVPGWIVNQLNQNAVAIQSLTKTNNAVTAMSGPLMEMIQSTSRSKELTPKNGESETLKKLKGILNDGTTALNLENETLKRSGKPGLENVDLLANLLSNYLQTKITNAQFVAGNSQSAFVISTTTISPGWCEESFAVGATTAWECLGIMQKELKKRSGICLPINSIFKTGENNWRSGLSYGRCFAALHRHVWAFWLGETHDSESGLHHLAHAICCLLFLLEYQFTETGIDDRPTGDEK